MTTLQDKKKQIEQSVETQEKQISLQNNLLNNMNTNLLRLQGALGLINEMIKEEEASKGIK